MRKLEKVREKANVLSNQTKNSDHDRETTQNSHNTR